MLDRRGTPPAGQQRSMNVDASEFWRIEYRLWQDQPIGSDDSHIRSKFGKGALLLRRAQALRRPDLNPLFLRIGMDRAWPQFLSPPRRPRRLGVDAADLMPGIDQGR